MACRCSMCFVVLGCFRIVLSFASFFSALHLKVIQLVLGRFSFVSGCYIGDFKLFTLRKFIEVVFGLLTRFFL